MKRILILHICFLLLTLMSSFMWIEGFWRIEKSESFIEKKESIKNGKILFFPPEITMTEVTDDVENNFVQQEEQANRARKYLKSTWKKFKINGVFFDEPGTNKPSFKQYQKLLELRKEIIQANNLQNHPLENRDINPFGRSQSVFVNTPKINFGYGSLSKELNTPFFAITGYIINNISPQNTQMRSYTYEHNFRGRGKYHYYYYILVDVESSEIIYREFKKLPLKLNKLTIQQFLYESYAVLDKNLES